MRFGIRESICLLLLLAMPVAAYYFVFEPRNRQIADARKEIIKKQRKLKELEDQTKSIADLGAEIDRLTESIEISEQKLPAEREVGVILKKVWELAAKHDLQPKSVRPDKAVSAAHYSELPIKMKILGDFDGFYSFLLDLEQLRRITRMPQMSLKKMKTVDEGQMTAEVILSIFFEKQDGDPSAVTRRSRL